MKKYDDIVVGSGISGLTLALLLGLNGHRVLLLEKNPHIGGALTRFYREGIPFDTGFHFTGGFYKNGIFHDMLTVLGIRDYIQPIFFSDEQCNQFVFESEQVVCDMPPGVQTLKKKLKGYFPGEHSAIDRYFDMAKNVHTRTVSIDLSKISLSPNFLDEDFISLNDVLDQLTGNRLLKGLLSGFSMCYGVKPAEVSFANHSRVCFNMYESVARVKDGGEAFIRIFQQRFAELDIEVMCGRYITDCVDIQDGYVGRFILNTGEEVTGDHCILTIHPQEILKLLPKKHLRKAFINRVSAFEPSAGFFSVFGIMGAGSSGGNFDHSIVSLFPTSDVNQLLDPGYTGLPALVIIKSRETVNGKSYQIVNAFEPSFPEHVVAWKDSKVGIRPPEYQDYKKQRVDSITKRIIGFYPEHRDSFKVMDAASILTFRDYLHSPYGSAYGIKQKVGQHNLLGKLRLRNIYVAGQSSVLPGLVGAMISSFIVWRSIVGKEIYSRFIKQRLCN